LKMAAETTEEMVDAVLEQLMSKNVVPRWTTVEDFIPADRDDTVYELAIEPARLDEYDNMLAEGC